MRFENRGLPRIARKVLGVRCNRSMSVANWLPLAPGTPGERGSGGEGRATDGSTLPC